ncbi:MAG: RNA polymerase sigma factor [Myxococcota bacterium]
MVPCIDVFALGALISTISHSRALAPVVPIGAAPADETLVMRALDGDHWSFEALYRRHARRLLNLATRLLGSLEEAEDVVQDAFVSAFDDLHRLQEPKAFGAWVARITVRLVHRRWRRTKLRRTLGFRGADELGGLESLADPRADAETRARLAELDAALRSLAAEDRSAWMLRHVEGMQLEQVAAVSGCSLATAKRRIRRADERVQRTLGAERGP